MLVSLVLCMLTCVYGVRVRVSHVTYNDNDNDLCLSLRTCLFYYVDPARMRVYQIYGCSLLYAADQNNDQPVLLLGYPGHLLCDRLVWFTGC